MANLLAGIGMMSFLPFFPSLLEELGLSGRDEVALWSGLIFGAAPLAATVASPLWGALGDRFGRKLMLVRSLLGIVVFVGAMAFAKTPLQLFLLRLCQGTFSGFVAPSITLVSVQAPPGRQGSVAGTLQTALALGAVIGPLLGGLVGESVGHRAVFGWVAASAGLAAFLVVLLAREDVSTRRAPERGRREGLVSLARAVLGGTLRDIRAVWGNRTLRSGIVLLFWIQFGLGATNPQLEFFVRDLRGPGAAGGEVSAHYTSLLFAALALANLIALPRWGKRADRRGHRTTLLLCASLTAACLWCHALAPVYAVVLVARLALGVSTAGAGPSAFGLAAAEISADRRGGAFGIVFGARTLAVALAGPVGGALLPLLGVRGLFAASGTLVVLCLVVLRPDRGSVSEHA